MLTTYQWKPPAREPFLTFAFCKTCGVRISARGEMEALGGVFHAVALTTLDEASHAELAEAPIKYIDGRHDRFEHSPDDTRLM